MIPALLGIIIAFSVMGTALVETTLTNFTIVGNMVKSQQAFNVAEAGLDYYMWHLNHNGTDYKDGQSTPANPDPTLGYGPYTHTYTDATGANQGTYTLWIKPAGNGSTIATVRSIGQAAGTSIKRTVQAQIGSPSFASYGLVGNSEFWFGKDETADGPIFSNVGIRLDGPNTGVAGAANATYKPTEAYGGCHGDNCPHPGVWCDTSVLTPVNCNTRNKSNWHYPLPTVDFTKVSGSLCTMKKTAFADDPSTASLATGASPCTQTPNKLTNAYIPRYDTTGSFSLSKGYLIKLRNNGTYDLYKVSAENDRPIPYASYATALTTTLVQTGISLPPSGVIFVEDNVWVLTSDANGFHGRVTIASGRLATSDSTDIVLAGPLAYSTKNGSDAIGLVTENSILVAPYAPASAPGYSSGTFNYEIDGALLAENGNVFYGENTVPSGVNKGLFIYRSATGNCSRGWVSPNQTLTFYGSVATNTGWTWNQQIGGSCADAVRDPSTGYYIAGIEHTTTSYDYNLQYAPPPSYPLTSGYNILSWREVLTHP